MVRKLSSSLFHAAVACAMLLMPRPGLRAQPVTGRGDGPGWEWSDTERRRIQSLAGTLRPAADGTWTHDRPDWQVRCGVSAEVTAEAACYVELLLRAFPRVFGLTLPARNVRFGVTVHGNAQTYAEATGNARPEDGRYAVTAQPDGVLAAEVHVLAGVPAGEAAAGLADRVDLGVLQHQAACALLQLCAGGRPLPPFVREGCAAYFAAWDVREPKPPVESRMARYGRRERLRALQAAVLDEAARRPDLFKLANQSKDDFAGGDTRLQTALAESFIDYAFASARRRSVLQTLIARAAQPPAAGGDGAAAPGPLTAEAAAALEPEWHAHLIRVVAQSLPVAQIDIAVEGSPPGAPSHTALSAYGHAPHVAVLPAARGAYDIAYYDRGARTVRIAQCDADNRKTGEVTPAFITDAGGLLGAVRLPRDGSYVVGFSRDNAAGDKSFEYWLARFDRQGKKIFEQRVFGDKPSGELWSKGGPGGAGTARIAYNPASDMLGVYLSHSMKWPDNVRHQGGFVGFLRPDGKQPVQVANGWFFSHNFDQRLIVADGAFYALAHGDAFPRALGFSKWTDGAKGGALTVNVNYHTIPGNTGDNTTHCQTGGLAPLKDRAFAVLFATSNDRPSHDVCLKILSDSGAVQREAWLTAYGTDRYAAYPRIARYGADILAAWQEVAAGGGASAMQLLLVDSAGRPQARPYIVPDAHVPPMYDLVNLDDGSVVWALPGGGTTIRVCRIELPGAIEARLARGLAERARQAATAKRVPKAGAIAGVDAKMVAKLAGLPADGNLLKGSVRLSKARTPVRLAEARDSGELTLEADGGQRATVLFGSLTLADRAALALALLRLEPDNAGLRGVAGFYLDCDGNRTAARECYQRAGPAVAATFAALFEGEDE